MYFRLHMKFPLFRVIGDEYDEIKSKDIVQPRKFKTRNEFISRLCGTIARVMIDLCVMAKANTWVVGEWMHVDVLRTLPDGTLCGLDQDFYTWCIAYHWNYFLHKRTGLSLSVSLFPFFFFWLSRYVPLRKKNGVCGIFATGE